MNICKNKITVEVHDNHKGLEPRIFDYDVFKDTVFHVIKVNK